MRAVLEIAGDLDLDARGASSMSEDEATRAREEMQVCVRMYAGVCTYVCMCMGEDEATRAREEMQVHMHMHMHMHMSYVCV